MALDIKNWIDWSGWHIAPRHMAAIRETGNNLIAAYDPNDLLV